MSDEEGQATVLDFGVDTKRWRDNSMHRGVYYEANSSSNESLRR